MSVNFCVWTGNPRVNNQFTILQHGQILVRVELQWDYLEEKEGSLRYGRVFIGAHVVPVNTADTQNEVLD